MTAECSSILVSSCSFMDLFSYRTQSVAVDTSFAHARCCRYQSTRRAIPSSNETAGRQPSRRCALPMSAQVAGMSAACAGRCTTCAGRPVNDSTSLIASSSETGPIGPQVDDLKANVRQPRDRAARDVLDKGEIARLAAVAIDHHRAPFADPLHQAERHHVGPAGRPVHREIAEHRHVEAVEVMIGVAQGLGGLLRGGVG